MTLDEYLARQSPNNAQVIKIMIIIAVFAFIFGMIVSINNFKNGKNDSDHPVELNSLVGYFIGAILLYVLFRWWSFGLYLAMIYGLMLWYG